MKSLGLGLIGYGGFGRFCAQALSSLPDVFLTAVADTDPQRRSEAISEGLRTFAQVEELLACPDVDIVHINTPPATHAPLGIAAARAGKHVFCEKPLALSVEAGLDLIAALHANGVLGSVNYVMRFNPLNARLRDLLRSQIFGPLHHISLQNWATDEPLKPGHWFWQPEHSGGIWIEHGVHFFDLFSWLTGQEADAVASTGQVRPDGCLDRVWGLVRYSQGLIAEYHHAFTQPQRIEQTTIRMACSRGYISLYGWIPTHMVVEGLLDDAGLEGFREWSGREPQILERYHEEDRAGWASGAPYRAAVRVREEIELAEGKAEVYRASIRAALMDMVHSIQDPNYRPVLRAEDTLASLAVAQAANRAAVSKKWEPIPGNSDQHVKDT